MSSISAEEQIIEIVNDIGLEGVAGILRDIIHIRMNNIQRGEILRIENLVGNELKLFSDYKVMLENCHEIIRLASKHQV